MYRKKHLWQSYQQMTNKLRGRMFTTYMEEKPTHNQITRFQKFREPYSRNAKTHFRRDLKIWRRGTRWMRF